MHSYDSTLVNLEVLIARYPCYCWRIWTRRYCSETNCEVLSASSFFLDMPNETLFAMPAIGDDEVEALITELNQSAGWDCAIRIWQTSRLRALIDDLPAAIPGVVGHG